VNHTYDACEQQVRFAGSELRAHTHICGFFRNSEEEYLLLLPCIKQGIEQGEKEYHVVNPALRKAHLHRLESAGIDAKNVVQENPFFVPPDQFLEEFLKSKANRKASRIATN
jgi:hypothetical protein